MFGTGNRHLCSALKFRTNICVETKALPANLTTVGRCYYAVSQLTVATFLTTWRRLLPDFGRIIQGKRQEEEKERRPWNNQVSFPLFLYIHC